MRYAYFAGPHRLAVATGDDVWVYDTLQHSIGGFSQQQSADGSITFTSQFGVVPLSTLPVVSRNGVDQTSQTAPAPEPAPTPPPVLQESPVPAQQPTAPAPAADTPANPNDVFDTINRLGGLLDKGYITQEEFDRKKSDLLDRI